MSNLGMYQTIVVLAKKMGGPKNFIGCLLVAGGVAGSAITAGISKINNGLKKKSVNSSQDAITLYPYEILKNGKEKKLSVKKKDRFRVVDSDDDVIFIEKLSDPGSLYAFSIRFLEDVSDFDYQANL